MIKQPIWNIVANLGDETPLDFGGYFVMVDETGTYPPEAEKLEIYDVDGQREWYVYSFILEQCTYIDGILSDNKFHPDKAAWFATPADKWYPKGKLAAIADSCGVDESELITLLCSADPIERANGYGMIGDYFGFHELHGGGGDGDCYTNKFDLMNHYRRLQSKSKR